MNIRRSLALATAALAAASLTACSQPTASTPSDSTAQTGGQLKVMASFYPLKYLTEQIGGELTSVTSLTPDGAEPHDLELSPASVDQLGKADAVVYLKGFQSAVDEAVEHNAPKTVIDVAPAVQLVKVSDSGNHVNDHDHDADHDHEADHDHDHKADHDHDHDHDMSTDPHFWLDPERMSQAATLIGQALADADPKNAQTYTSNAANVAHSMKDLGTELVSGTATCEHTTFVTAHAAFGYLADRTGLTQVGISGLDPDSSPSPARLQEISELVKAQGVSTIFTEALIDPKVAETLAKDLGIETAVLDPIESQVNPNEDYAAAMRNNITALRKALHCK
ncbi:metal ABC transporter substrate-binding protein [Actinomyces mediterranea]|uniref:metal ABC transporter substrate-binding protein n=1 Tax=Actinomyces mediterranea TaxID=1871028 RepID=UPI000971451D|nr:metal ABC transporter substrate-binding protein [Actinomyces mediterranea]